MTRRDAILSGVLAATELHDELDTVETVQSGIRGNVPVFDAILRTKAHLVFRPLRGLLGACLPGPGVIITTERPLPLQRFTGAHELGHVVLHHDDGSVDGDEILTGKFVEDELVELQANSFAAEFLIPKWLLEYHADHQKWNRKAMENPIHVYQMALRVGASYEATIVALRKHKIISPAVSGTLLDVTPKSIKQELLHGYLLPQWYPDVWLITEKDEGLVIEGQPNDLFRFRLGEKTGAGYLWNVDELKANGFTIAVDETIGADTENIGADVKRALTAHSPTAPTGDLHLQMKRPWETSSMYAAQLLVHYDLNGKEQGLPRALRAQLANAA